MRRRAKEKTDIKSEASRKLHRLRREGCEADLWWSIEGVGVEDGLDHDEGLRQVLPDKVVPVVGRLVRAVVEHLQERRPPQVEHELQAEKRGQWLEPLSDVSAFLSSGTEVYLWVEGQRL